MTHRMLTALILSVPMFAPNARATDPCAYDTLWGVVSTNLGDARHGCHASDAAGCDLWVYELAYSSAKTPFITALRRVTRTPGIGEIDARMQVDDGVGPQVIADFGVASDGGKTEDVVETHSWDETAWYGFDDDARVADSIDDADGFDDGGVSDEMLPGQSRDWYLAASVTMRKLAAAGRCETVREVASVARDGLVLYSAMCEHGGATENSELYLLPRRGDPVALGPLMGAFIRRHPELRDPRLGAAPDFYGGDIALDTSLCQPRSRIYASLSSHNEEATQQFCAATLGDEAHYVDNRTYSLRMGDVVARNEAAWDLQSDYLYIRDSLAWDDANFTTAHDGLTVLPYLARSPRYRGRISVEAHTHDDDTTYLTRSYADIAAYLDLVGVPRTDLAGGFNWSDDVSMLASTVVGEYWGATDGEACPSSWAECPPTFDASILTFASLGNHYDGSDIALHGIWYPSGDGAAFFDHDKTAALGLVNLSFGDRGDGAYGSGKGLDKILGELSSYPALRLYPHSIFFDQCTLAATSPAHYASVIRSYRPAVNRGDLVWATFPTMVADWEAIYGSAPSCADTDPYVYSGAPPTPPGDPRRLPHDCGSGF